MLFNYIFLFHGLDDSLPISGNDDEIIIPINGITPKDKKSLFVKLHNSNIKFSFFVKKELLDETVELERVVNFLIPLLFLPNYITYQGRLLLLIEKSSLTTNILSLEEELNKQLSTPVLIDTIDSTLKSKGRAESICNYHADLDLFLQEQWDKAVSFDSVFKELSMLPLSKKLIVRVNSADDFSLIHSNIYKFETWIRQTYPNLFEIFQNYKQAESIRWNLNSENKVLREKLQNSFDNLRVLRDNSLWYVQEYNRLMEAPSLRHQAESEPAFMVNNSEEVKQLRDRLEYIKKNRENIIEWYDKEYEVLPKWYKRFGHIIKVAKGKRTFKSLFK